MHDIVIELQGVAALNEAIVVQKAVFGQCDRDARAPMALGIDPVEPSVRWVDAHHHFWCRLPQRGVEYDSDVERADGHSESHSNEWRCFLQFHYPVGLVLGVLKHVFVLHYAEVRRLPVGTVRSGRTRVEIEPA